MRVRNANINEGERDRKQNGVKDMFSERQQFWSYLTVALCQIVLIINKYWLFWSDSTDKANSALFAITCNLGLILYYEVALSYKLNNYSLLRHQMQVVRDRNVFLLIAMTTLFVIALFVLDYNDFPYILAGAIRFTLAIAISIGAAARIKSVLRP